MFVIYLKGHPEKLHMLSSSLYYGASLGKTKSLFGVTLHLTDDDKSYSRIPDGWITTVRNELSKTEYQGIMETTKENLVSEGYIKEEPDFT